MTFEGGGNQNFLTGTSNSSLRIGKKHRDSIEEHIVVELG